MSTTYGALKTRIANVLLDPNNKTFTTTLVPELAIAALVELGRVLPMQYHEDITPVANQMSYQLGTALFATAEPQIEVARVEVWDTAQTPDRLVFAVPPAANEWSPNDSGWSNWGGLLYLPNRVVAGLVGHETDYLIKVFGYAPYPTPSTDADVVALSQAAEQGAVKYARVEGLEMLLANRDLFTQWQTRSGNSDISPAGLMNQLSAARADWRQYSRAIQQLRTPV